MQRDIGIKNWCSQVYFLHLMSNPTVSFDLTYISSTPLNPYSASCPTTVYAFRTGNHYTYSLVLVLRYQYLYTLLAEIASPAILHLWSASKGKKFLREYQI